MSRLRNVRLGARLAIAFALLLGGLITTVVVGVGAIRSLDTDNAGNVQGANLRAMGTVDAVAVAVQGGAHDIVRHLYVYDGDLKAQDAITKESTARTAGLQKEAEVLGRSLTSDAARKEFQAVLKASEPLVATTEKAYKLSRQETVDQVEERVGSRTTYLEEYLPAQQALAAATERLRKAIAADLDAAIADASDKAEAGERTLILVGIVGTLLAIALSLLITKSVTTPTARLVARLRSVQEQDLTELDAGLHAMAEGDLTRRVAAVTEPIGDTAKDEVGEAARVVDEVVGQSRASIDAYERMRAELGALLGGVRRSAFGVTGASQQMASSSQEAGRALEEIAGAMTELARGSERQIMAVDQVRRGAEEVGGRIGASAAAAQATADAAATAREVALEGAETAKRATEAMREVGESTSAVTEAIRELAGRSEEIAGIVQSITGIAEQTNLLALNAAIEAARAGEQGRGFAVVAEEVRKLAEEAQTSAGRIADVLAEVQRGTRDAVALVDDGAKRTAQGSEVVEQAKDAFERIGGAVEDMTDRVTEIAAAAQQIASEATRMHDEVAGMASIAEQSSASTQQVSASTEETSASTQEVAASAQELATTAAELERLVDRFRLEAEEAATEAEQAEDAEEQLA